MGNIKYQPPLYHQYLVDRKLLADHIRNGVCRGLYSDAMAQRMLTLLEEQEEILRAEATRELSKEV